MTKVPQKHVLIVEEADGIALAIDKLMSREGHHCARVRCASDAEGALAAERPDLVMIDGDADGLCAVVRSTPGLAATKILVMHGSGKTIDRRRSRAMGADAFLAKPFHLSELKSEVRRLLDAAGGM